MLLELKSKQNTHGKDREQQLEDPIQSVWTDAVETPDGQSSGDYRHSQHFNHRFCSEWENLTLEFETKDHIEVAPDGVVEPAQPKHAEISGPVEGMLLVLDDEQNFEKYTAGQKIRQRRFVPKVILNLSYDLCSDDQADTKRNEKIQGFSDLLVFA